MESGPDFRGDCGHDHNSCYHLFIEDHIMTKHQSGYFKAIPMSIHSNGCFETEIRWAALYNATPGKPLAYIRNEHREVVTYATKGEALAAAKVAAGR